MALSEAKSTGREHRSTFEGCDHGRRFADETGALLVFDEMMTGFRIAYGGARERFDVTPDLTALGAVIGGGLPLAAHGNAEIDATLDHLDRAGAAALTGRN